MFGAQVMSKLLVIVAILAISITSQESTETYDKFGFPETIDRLECKNASTTVLEKQESFYQDYVKCVKNVVDIKLMNQEIRFMLRTIIPSLKFTSTIPDYQISAITIYAQSYCPKFTTLMNCEKTYSSIYSDCLTPAEVQAKNIKRDFVRGLLDFFCKDNAKEVMNFIKGKFFECGMYKKYELKGCLGTMLSTMKIVADNVPLTTDVYCKSIDEFFNCITTILQQCESSESPGKLMESLHSYLQKSGMCFTADGEMMKQRMSLL